MLKHHYGFRGDRFEASDEWRHIYEVIRMSHALDS